MNKIAVFSLALAASASMRGEVIDVKRVAYAGPFEIVAPAQLGRPLPAGMDKKEDLAIYPSAAYETITLDSIAPGCEEAEAAHVISFDVDARRYTGAKLIVEGLENVEATLDGEKLSDISMKLSPATHRIEVKYASRPSTRQKISIRIDAEKDGAISLPEDGTRMMTLSDIMYGTRISGASISPSGRYILERKQDVDEKGQTRSSVVLYDLKAKGGMQSRAIGEQARWMPKSDLMYAVREDYEHKRYLVTIDPATGSEAILFEKLPEGAFEVLPTEDALIFTLVREGQKEDPNVYQVLEPDDRQPGWRDRYYPALYRNGVLSPITTGVDNAYLLDVSDDGRKALVMSSHTGFGVGESGQPVLRPTTLSTLTLIDLNTFKADTLVVDDGFITGGALSPDASKVLVKGTPEAFSRIGCTLPDSVTPSMVQQELFIVDANTKEVTPMSREFNPNPEEIAWGKYDGKIYFRAENRDMYTLYSLDPATGKYAEIEIPENIIKGFDLSRGNGGMAVWAQSDSNPDRLYFLDGKKGASAKLLDSPSESRLANVRLAKCIDYNFTNSIGDTIYGRYYLPDNFDPAKKYPMIVNYYGGCSPTQRSFETRYPWHLYAQMGYVVYVLNPSGATGFGQEFSSRHVSTAGEGVARDIIEGTRKFIADHDFVDGGKVGCIGASYGGFMTMYLQTVTDLFAAAISHAGISDHTSYWGEGYWGYSYSETSMGNDLPWTATDLYVKQSPLYRADKVKTPILFLHGDEDTNVPPGESIQMFTALKLLGVPTALVEVKGQNHHITEYGKRQKWQDTIFAWFARYLQDDPSWWDAMYPAKGY
ncbi:MAG: prolyl oligopeptidase family serine peptidase [Clostridium sp.]|nr:prolyl oligopeptidase family serine peptidase [Clostridium sp.]